jgi:hypothetical protein
LIETVVAWCQLKVLAEGPLADEEGAARFEEIGAL